MAMRVSVVDALPPPDVPMVAVSNNILSPSDCRGMPLRAKQAIDSHQDTYWLLAEDDAAAVRGEVILGEFYGMRRLGQCLDYPSSLLTAQIFPQKRVAMIQACAEARGRFQR